jgi:hypothetical protein
MVDGMLVQQATNAVNDLCAPDKMSKADAVDFLESVIENLQTSVDVLKEEIENEDDS